MIYPITFALPKGRPFEPTLRLLQEAGLACDGLNEDSRSLIIDCPERRIRFIVARPSDVATYVEHGAADLGVAGKDSLMEGNYPVYEILNLRYMPCRFVLAAPEDSDEAQLLNGVSRRRVATRFRRVAEEYFRNRGQDMQIIYLHGATEVAPAVGLADMIVDITETGRTLRENRLKIIDHIGSSSARLIANQAAYRLKAESLAPIISALRDATAIDRRNQWCSES